MLFSVFSSTAAPAAPAAPDVVWRWWLWCLECSDMKEARTHFKLVCREIQSYVLGNMLRIDTSLYWRQKRWNVIRVEGGLENLWKHKLQIPQALVLQHLHDNQEKSEKAEEPLKSGKVKRFRRTTKHSLNVSHSISDLFYTFSVYTAADFKSSTSQPSAGVYGGVLLGYDGNCL